MKLQNYLYAYQKDNINTKETFTACVRRIQADVFTNFKNEDGLSYSEIAEQVVDFVTDNWEWQTELIFPLDNRDNI